MTPRTAYLAKLTGLFYTVIGLTMAVNRESSLAAFLALASDPAALWLSAMTGMAAGLALVLGHNVWTGGAPTVVVTILGWIVTLKCAAVLMLPAGTMSALAAWLKSPAVYYGDAIAILALGAYLTAAGFRASDNRKL